MAASCKRAGEVSFKRESSMEKDPDRNDPDKQPPSLAAVRKAHVFGVLQMCGGNRRRAAEILGVSERELRRQMKTLGIACVNGAKKKEEKPNRIPKGGQADE